MSYDISFYINIDTGGPEPQHVELTCVGNYTSNASRMWATALGYRLSELKEKNAGESLADLDRAVTAMENSPEIYQAMNPANGWGDYEGALDYLRCLRDGCALHPRATIYISH